MHGEGACMPHMPPPHRHYGYGIWSMSRQYASYWNAFLFEVVIASIKVSFSFHITYPKNLVVTIRNHQKTLMKVMFSSLGFFLSEYLDCK